MKQPEYILEKGTKIRTHETLGSTVGLGVHVGHIRARRSNVQGTITGVVGGHGGDVYFVRHEAPFSFGWVEAAYSFQEFELDTGEPEAVDGSADRPRSVLRILLAQREALGEKCSATWREFESYETVIRQLGGRVTATPSAHGIATEYSVDGGSGIIIGVNRDVAVAQEDVGNAVKDAYKAYRAAVVERQEVDAQIERYVGLGTASTIAEVVRKLDEKGEGS